jgi:hypothetical protein
MIDPVREILPACLVLQLGLWVKPRAPQPLMT